MTVDPRNLVEIGGGEGAFTEFCEVEMSISAVKTQKENVLKLDLSPSLIYRRVYFYAEVSLQTYGDDFGIIGQVSFVRNQRPIAQLPAGVGRNLKQGLAWSKSISSLACATTVPGPDAIQLALSYKFTGNTSLVYLTPMRVTCQADVAYWSITGVDARDCNIDNLRAYLGIISSNRP